MPITTPSSRKKQLVAKKRSTTGSKKSLKTDLVKQSLKKQRAKKLAAVLKSKRPDLNKDESEEEEDSDAEDAKATNQNQKSVMDIFKRNFEQQFGKVEGLAVSSSEEEPEAKQEDPEDEDSSDEDSEIDTEAENNSDFDLEMDQEYEHYQSSEESEENEEQDEEQPIVVKFTDSLFNMDALTDKKQKKLFVSSKAPKQELPEEKLSRNNNKPDEEEQLNLDNDLALQRLIKESHILAEAGLSGVDISTGIIGRARHKTMDIRMDDLGLKKVKPDRMPMNMRKGMTAKAKERHETHVRQSREAGIILARPAKVNDDKKKVRKRERGLKIASVGRETRHGLMISKSEIAKYSGTGGGKKGRR